ncbi:MAG TPA: sugar transferase [Solirubrobacteraceae bacterium]
MIDVWSAARATELLADQDAPDATPPAELLADQDAPDAAPPAERSSGAELSPVWEIQAGLDRHLPNRGVSVLLRRDAVMRRALAIGDVLATYLALGFALDVIGGASIHPRPAILLLAPFVVLVSKGLGLYDRDQHLLRKTTIDEIPTILHLCVFWALTFWLGEWLFVGAPLRRAQIFAMTIVGFGLTVAARSLARGLAVKATPPERCILIGNADDAARTANKLSSSSGVSAVLLGRLGFSEAGADQARRENFPVLGTWRELARVVRAHAVERVIIAPGGDEESVLDCVRLVKALGVKVSVLPRLLEVVGSSAMFDEIDGITLLGVRQYGLSKSSALLKRLVDVVGAVVGLVLLAPVFVILAVAIRVDSPGPPFFRQLRIGRRGERFSMLKFRTMVKDADELKARVRHLNEVDGGLFKIGDDPRITRVGRFLRRTSVDELPQLFNVLKGDMSLVGPRPLVQDEDALIEGWRRRRLAVKPGMTGLWQVFGSARIPMHEMVKIDYIYGANWSVWLDVKILLRTLPYMVTRRGL